MWVSSHITPTLFPYKCPDVGFLAPPKKGPKKGPRNSWPRQLFWVPHSCPAIRPPPRRQMVFQWIDMGILWELFGIFIGNQSHSRLFKK